MKGGTFCGSSFSCTLFMVQPSRVSDTPSVGGSPFLGTLYMVHTSCVSNTPLPGRGISPSADGGRTALPRGA